MTDQLLSLARECGAMLMNTRHGGAYDSTMFIAPAQLTAFAERIRQDERERCALMADEWSRPSVVKLAAGEMTASELRTAQAVASGLAGAIRSSGTSGSNPGKSDE